MNLLVCIFKFVVPVDYRLLYHSGNIECLQLVVAPLLSVIHIYSVCEEMRAAPVNTLNPQRTAIIVADFVKVHIQRYKVESDQFTSQLTKFSAIYFRLEKS